MDSIQLQTLLNAIGLVMAVGGLGGVSFLVLGELRLRHRVGSSDAASLRDNVVCCSGQPRFRRCAN